MRVRILRDISLAANPSVKWVAGSIADVSPETARKWIEKGIAMEDKSTGPVETKADKIRRQTRDRVAKYRERKAKEKEHDLTSDSACHISAS